MSERAGSTAGYAIRQGEKILVDTVFGTSLGAIVNWLQVYTPYTPRNWETEAELSRVFKEIAPEGVALIRIRIEHDAG